VSLRPNGSRTYKSDVVLEPRLAAAAAVAVGGDGGDGMESADRAADRAGRSGELVAKRRVVGLTGCG